MQLFDKLPLILDCASGTEMQKHGLKPGECSEKWILENPEPLMELERGCVEAGSDIIYAPTFGANKLLLSKHGLEKNVRDYTLRLVELSQKAVGGKAFIAGDMAPTGAVLEPYGDMERETLFEVFEEQARCLEEAGVDLFVVETQLSGEEALVTVEAVKSVSKKPILVSFTSTENGRTFFGEKFSDLLLTMQEQGVSAFGVNCVGDFELLKKLVTEMKAVSKIPLIVKPNAGIPLSENGKNIYKLSPEDFAEHMAELNALGASLLGGCCGTDIRHIAALVKKLV